MPPAGFAAAGERSVEDVARQRGIDPDLLIRPWRLGAQPREWLSRQAVGRPGPERLRVAFHQLLAAAGRGIRYEADATGTADEVFASGRANRLGFAFLFVGLARELGIEAGFYRVPRRGGYERRGDLIHISEHVTAGYEAEGQSRRIEFTLGSDVNYGRATAISDLTALTLFYSNRGAEALRDGDARRAVRWLEVAVRLDETEASAWTNLGVARRRLGDLPAAEAAYRRAIELDRGHLAAYVNLARLLELRGLTDGAREIVRLLDQDDNRNPYAYLELGDASLAEGRQDDARRYYRRAVRLGRGDAEPRAAMGLLELATGEAGKARRWLRRARRIDHLDERTLQLEQRLTEHSPSPGTAAAAAGREPSEREVES